MGKRFSGEEQKAAKEAKGKRKKADATDKHGSASRNQGGETTNQTNRTNQAEAITADSAKVADMDEGLRKESRKREGAKTRKGTGMAARNLRRRRRIGGFVLRTG